MHGFQKYSTELYLLFIWKTEYATKITNDSKHSAAMSETVMDSDDSKLRAPTPPGRTGAEWTAAVIWPME